MNINTVPSVLFRWLRLAFIPVIHAERAARTQTTSVSLRRNQVLTIPKRSVARRIEVRRGAVWLTGTPAKRDIVLRAEEYLCLADQHPFVVEALADAEIILTR